MSPTKKLEISPKCGQKQKVGSKNGLYYGQKWADFGAKRVQLQKPAIHSKPLPKSAKNNLCHRWYTIGSKRSAMGVWSGPIGLKAKDPYLGEIGI